MSIVPVQAAVIVGYLHHRFLMGRTARTIPSILTKLRHFYRVLLERPWLSDLQQKILKDSVKATSKYDFTTPTKALPLYRRLLIAIAPMISSPSDQITFTAWCLAHITMSRFGEITNSLVRQRNLQCYDLKGGFYVFFYRRPPKSHQTTPPPYALCSRSRSPFVFAVLHRCKQTICASSPADAPLFPAIKTTGHLTTTIAVQRLQHWLTRLHVPTPSRYTGHSARRGGFNDYCSTIPESHIHAQGHWTTGSQTANLEHNVQALWDRLQYF